MTQDADKQAEELLPCEACNGMGKPPHTIGCPANYRPVVAAALREAYLRGTGDMAADASLENHAAQAEIAQLKAELQAAREYIAGFSRGIDEVKDGDS